MMKVLSAFSLVLVFNFVWAKCVAFTAKGDAAKAALCSGILTIVSGAITITYIEDHRMVIPAAVGSLIGTYLAVKFVKK